MLRPSTNVSIAKIHFFIIQTFFDNFSLKKQCEHSHTHHSQLTDNLRFAISVGAYQTRTMHAHTCRCVLEMYILSLHCMRNARHLNNPAQGASRSVGQGGKNKNKNE